MFSEFKNEGDRISLVNSLGDYSSWADNTETISKLDRIARLFIVILHCDRKYSQTEV